MTRARTASSQARGVGGWRDGRHQLAAAAAGVTAALQARGVSRPVEPLREDAATSWHLPSWPEVPRCGGHRSFVRGEAQQRRGACRQLAGPARAVIALGLAALQLTLTRWHDVRRQPGRPAHGVTSVRTTPWAGCNHSVNTT